MHELPYRGKTDDWLTPPELVRSLGRFDLDPCACKCQPWHHAEIEYTIDDDGLSQAWTGRVWLNPPYGRPKAKMFLRKMAEHGNGIALLYARTETDTFHKYVWPQADAMLFLRKRVSFCRPDGSRSIHSTGPSVLIAYGKNNALMLEGCGLCGAFVDLSIGRQR